MSLLSVVETPITFVKDEAIALYEALVPPAMKAELGTLGSAIVANISYDAKQMGLAAEAIAQADVAQVWTLVKGAVSRVGSDLASGKFEPTLAGVLGELTSVGVQDVFPALKVIGQTTLKTMITAAGSMVVSGMLTAAPVAPAAPAAPAPAKP